MADSSSQFGFSLGTTNIYKDKPTLSMSAGAVNGQLRNPGKVYTQNIGRRVNSLQWETAEWDLAECGRIIDVEGYVRRALRTKQDLFLKEGYEFNGANVERNKYIMKRLAQIEMATNKPIPMLMSETVASLKRCSNAYWAKVRDYAKSGGKRRVINKREIDPVAGYFLLPPESIQIKRDESGRIVKYRQVVWGKEPKEFRPEDIIHWYADKREGFAVGVPEIVPIKDDIRALRRIEENVELLVYQHLFPLFHYQVGTDDRPATVTPDGDDEVVVMQKLAAQMPSDGCWVTSERHKITAIEANSPPIAVDKVIEHFKQRIYIGLGVSPIDMGEGGSASRSTAQTLSRNLINSTKAYQKEFGAQFYHNVIVELLLESTFNEETLFEEENRVYLRFKEIDQETRIAKENHLMDMFLKNGITHDELRIESGRQPFVGDGWPTGTSKKQMFSKGDGEFAKTNYGLIERDKIILQSLDEPGTDASKAEVASRATANKTKSAGGNSVSNKNQPKNQHGTRSSAKLNKDSFIPRSHLTNLEAILLQTAPLSASYKSIKSDVTNKVRQKGIELKVIEADINFMFTRASDRLFVLSKQAFRQGLQKAGHDIWELEPSRVNGKIQDHINKYIKKLSNDIINSIKRNTTRIAGLENEDALFVSMILDSLEHRATQIDNSELLRAYNYGLLIGYQLSDIEKLNSDYTADGDCERCKNASLQIFLSNDIIYEELPPYHPFCSCTITPPKE